VAELEVDALRRGEDRMHYVLAELPFLEHFGSCAMCGAKLPALPPGTFDDRMFCGGICTLRAVRGDGREELKISEKELRDLPVQSAFKN
jgi:hypothetical protein